MTEQADIWRAARLLADRLGADARAHAANRASELLDAGDHAGHTLWTDIMHALERLLPPTRGSSD
jgi:hypothetical protein